jgi:hypothetical protein
MYNFFIEITPFLIDPGPQDSARRARSGRPEFRLNLFLIQMIYYEKSKPSA